MQETWVLIPGLGRSPGEGNSDPTGDLPVGVQESPVKAWVSGGLLQGLGM